MQICPNLGPHKRPLCPDSGSEMLLRCCTPCCTCCTGAAELSIKLFHRDSGVRRVNAGAVGAAVASGGAGESLCLVGSCVCRLCSRVVDRWEGGVVLFSRVGWWRPSRLCRPATPARSVSQVPRRQAAWLVHRQNFAHTRGRNRRFQARRRGRVSQLRFSWRVLLGSDRRSAQNTLILDTKLSIVATMHPWSSCPDLIRASIILQKRWIAGSRPGNDGTALTPASSRASNRRIA